MIQSTRLLTISMIALSLLLVALGVCIGSYGFENLILAAFNTKDLEAQALAQQILIDIRLPRTIGAWATGALLGLAGALAQGLFRNPLADPYLLGSAAGASLGVASALTIMSGGAGLMAVASGARIDTTLVAGLFSGNWMVRLGLTGAAFVGAVLAVLLTLALARGVQHTLRLLLGGVIVGVVLGAFTSLILIFSPESQQAMQSFLLGSTAFINWPACAVMLSVFVFCWLIAYSLAKVLDGLSLGEATASSLGLSIAPMRLTLIAILALATGTAVAQTGLIAFVGLAAPHLVRGMMKVGHKALVTLASLTGGILLTSADLIARGLIAPQELPVGAVTAVLGGTYLLWLMHKSSQLQNS